MKITIAFLISAVATVLNIEATDNPILNNQENKVLTPCINGIWNQGKIPYEISKEFDGKDLNLIKEALLDIMKTTCIKFVPRSNEADYVVFMEYNQPNQEKRSCWSGNKWNNGSSTVGNQKGRHIVSLWRDLECFNKLDIIRLMFNILGTQIKSSTLIFKNGKSVIYAAHKSYEEDFGNKDQRQSKTKTVLMQSCEKEKEYLRNYPYSADKIGWVQIARNDTCAILRSTIEIDGMYNCSATSNSGGKVSYELRVGYLVNGFGKGIFPYSGSNKSNYTLHQGRVGTVLLWSWNEPSIGSGDKHLCNSLGKCATSYKVDPVRPKEPPFIRQDDYMNKEGQRFNFVEVPAYPGFSIIKDEFGKCVSIYGNTDRVMSEVRSIDCNPSEAGQRWKWIYP